MTQGKLFKAIKERSLSVWDLRLTNDHGTVEVRAHTCGFHDWANSHVRVEQQFIFVYCTLDTCEVLIEEIIEAFLYLFSLIDQYSVALHHRVPDGSSCVQL